MKVLIVARGASLGLVWLRNTLVKPEACATGYRLESHFKTRSKHGSPGKQTGERSYLKRWTPWGTGDNPSKDFYAPQKFGWQTIRIRRPGGLHSDRANSPDCLPDLDIVSLDELQQLRRKSA